MERYKGETQQVKFHKRMVNIPAQEGEPIVAGNFTRRQILYLGELEKQRRELQSLQSRFSAPEIGPAILFPEESGELNDFLNRK